MAFNLDDSPVIGFRIGNCFSEIAIATKQIHGDITPIRVPAYLADGTTQLKIPTGVKYDQEDRLVACGHEAIQSGYSNGELVENFKRFLQLRFQNQPHEHGEEVDDPRNPTLTREKAIKACVDFIGHLNTLLEQHINEQSLDYDLQNAYFQFTLPSSYCANRLGGLSLEDFRQIIISEGSPFQEYHERVLVREESEAAAIHCITEYLKSAGDPGSQSLSKKLVNQCVLVWDAGYSGCELVSYRVNSFHPAVKVSQEHKIFSDSGSIVIDNAFYEYLLEELPEDYKGSPWDGFLETMASFRNCKESFPGGIQNEETEVVVRLFPEDLPHSKNRDGFLALSGAEMRSFFTKAIPEALTSNVKQLFNDKQESNSSIKIVFLIGGLGSSSPYETEIRKILRDISSAEIFKPAQPKAAICLGSVQSLLQELTQLSYSKSWGIIHPAIDVKQAKIDWFYDKGTVSNDSPNLNVPIKYRLPMTKAEMESNIHELKLVSYSGAIITRPNDLKSIIDQESEEVERMPTCLLYIPLDQLRQPKSSTRQTLREWTKNSFDSQRSIFKENDNIVKMKADLLEGHLRLTISEDSEDPAYSFVIGEYKNGNWTSSAI